MILECKCKAIKNKEVIGKLTKVQQRERVRMDS